MRTILNFFESKFKQEGENASVFWPTLFVMLIVFLFLGFLGSLTLLVHYLF